MDCKGAEKRRKASCRWMVFFLTVVTMIGMSGTNIYAAKDFPNRPIDLIIGMPAGGGLYMMSRVIAEKATQVLGQPITVTPKPGAGGTIAADFVRRAKPDGYTLMVCIPWQVANGDYLLSKVAYKNTDFEYFGMFGTNYMFLYVMSEKPWKNIEELVDYAKKNPSELKYPSISVGGHVSMETFCKATGIKMIHVPMKGEAETINAMIGGHVDVSMGYMRSLQAMTEAGKIRLLAAFTEKRTRYFPDVPTFGEKGYPEVTATDINFYGIVGPKGMPKEVSERLKDAFAKVFQDKDTAVNLGKLGTEAVYMPPTEFQKHILSIEKRFRKLYPEYGYKVLNE